MCTTLNCRVKERYINYAYAMLDIKICFEGKYLIFISSGSSDRHCPRFNRVTILRT